MEACNADLGADVGLGVEGGALCSSYHGWLICGDVDSWRRHESWMLGRRTRVEVHMVGSLAGIMKAMVAMPLGRIGGEECGGGWLRLALYR